MAKLNKEQLKKLYDYGGTLSPKDWADAIDSLVPDYVAENAEPIQITYKELKNLVKNSLLTPGQWYEFEHNPYIPVIPKLIYNKETKVRVKAESNNNLSKNALYYGVNEVAVGMGNHESVINWHTCEYDIDKFNNYLVDRNFNHEIVYELKSLTKDFLPSEVLTAIINKFIAETNSQPEYISSVLNTYDDETFTTGYSVLVFNRDHIYQISYGTHFDYELNEAITSVSAYKQYLSNYIYDPYESTGFVYNIQTRTSFLSYDISFESMYIGRNFIFKSDTTTNYIHMIVDGARSYNILSDFKVINSTIEGQCIYGDSSPSFQGFIDCDVKIIDHSYEGFCDYDSDGNMTPYGTLVGLKGILINVYGINGDPYNPLSEKTVITSPINGMTTMTFDYSLNQFEYGYIAPSDGVDEMLYVKSIK